MPKGYWIGHVTVHDPEMYPKYIEADALAFQKYDGKFLVRGGKYDCVEGNHRERNVVIEFDSVELAHECYNSPEYQAALKIRQACATTDMIIIEGTE